jgi:LacI family repressor for deo operon, udp, cdd, tsx, nupC, and nupG
MRDVADLARVGLSTVSRAFSEPEKVSRATLNRIELAVAKLNYVPNVSAQTLRAHQTGRVLVMIPAIGNVFFTPIMEGIEEVAAAAHRVVLLGDSRRGVGLTKSYTSRSYMTQLAMGRADALILLDGSLPIAPNDTADHRDEPVVAVSERSFAEFVPYVGIDNRKAAFDVTMYLGELGHRSFAHIAGRDGSTTATEREAGFREAMAALRVPEEDFFIERGDFTITSGREVVRRIIEHARRPTAVFCSNDDIAMVAIHELRKAGLHVPDDISVVGIDDVEVSRLFNPGLTTIRQPRYDMGRRGMQMIVDQLEGRAERIADVTLPHQLVLRDSASRPRVRARRP